MQSPVELNNIVSLNDQNYLPTSRDYCSFISTSVLIRLNSPNKLQWEPFIPRLANVEHVNKHYASRLWNSQMMSASRHFLFLSDDTMTLKCLRNWQETAAPLHHHHHHLPLWGWEEEEEEEEEEGVRGGGRGAGVNDAKVRRCWSGTLSFVNKSRPNILNQSNLFNKKLCCNIYIYIHTLFSIQY